MGDYMTSIFLAGHVLGMRWMLNRDTALLDFEISGFHPEYWEYATAIPSNHRVDPELDMVILWRNHGRLGESTSQTN